MKSRFALLIFVQLAAMWASASPVGLEARSNFIPFVDYPSEEADNARRSPTEHEHLPFVHYPGSESTHKTRRAPLVHVPFIHYPGTDVETAETDEKDSKATEARTIVHYLCDRDTAYTACKSFICYLEE
ncbi:hypothetical protein MSAN_01137600 [Mycena sanguinolenta]|uniref:Uncharacterized protein n=1 Tax=Mycena sanguinolenta TaxID=230812 RepID=A0A8H6YL47_9AGAR|nr:hypothetical protein MSAN_01137600 [Mycena sanguinolenta]